MGYPKHMKAFRNEKTGELVTPAGRLVWPTWLTPQKVKGYEDNPPKYSGSLLLPVGVDVKALEEAQADALVEAVGKTWQKKRDLRLVIRKTAEDEKLEQFAEEYPWVIQGNAYEDAQPILYEANLDHFDGEAKEIYSGRWAILAGTFKGYSRGKGGVNYAVKRIFLLGHAERLPIGGGPPRDTTEGFEPIELAEGESASEMFE